MGQEKHQTLEDGVAELIREYEIESDSTGDSLGTLRSILSRLNNAATSRQKKINELEAELRDVRFDLLVKGAMKAFDSLSPEEKEKHRLEQKISWVYGQVKLSGSNVTREQVAELVRTREALKV